MKAEGVLVGGVQREAERERMMGASRQTPDLVSSHARSNPDQDAFVQSPNDGWSLLQVSDTDCTWCGDPVLLFARVEGRPICSSCWSRKGQPFPRKVATVAEMHAAEIATRERMQKRGGADRHLVRSGRS